MNDEKIDIFIKYSHEINNIDNILLDLEKGRLYEIGKLPGVPKCSTMAERLRTEINDLLVKIDNNDKGFLETMTEQL